MYKGINKRLFYLWCTAPSRYYICDAALPHHIYLCSIAADVPRRPVAVIMFCGTAATIALLVYNCAIPPKLHAPLPVVICINKMNICTKGCTKDCFVCGAMHHRVTSTMRLRRISIMSAAVLQWYKDDLWSSQHAAA